MGNLCNGCQDRQSNKEPEQAPESPKELLAIAPSRSYNSDGCFSAGGKGELSRKQAKKRGILTPDTAVPKVKEAPNAIVSNKSKTSFDRDLILRTLRDHLIFAGLDDESKESALKEMRHFALPAHEYVYKQGLRAANFFILASGTAEILVDARPVKVLATGDGFGDVALMHDTLRTTSVRTLEDCELWGIERSVYRHFVEAVNAQFFEENKSFVNSVPLFSSLSPTQRESLVTCLSVSSHFPGQAIVKEGERGDWLYIIKEGEVVCKKMGTELRRMRKGEFFGEQSLLYGGCRTATVCAVTNVKCLYISSQNFKLALGDCMLNIIYTNTIKISLERTSLMSSLERSLFDKVANAMRIESFDGGSVVLYAGTRLDSGLWVVLKGSLRYEGTAKIFAETFGCFGISSDEDVKQDIVVASDLADIAWLTKDELETCIGGPVAQATANTEALSTLKQVQLLKSLPNDKMLALIQALRVREFADSALIVEQNTPGDAFYIIKSGQVDIIRDQVHVRTIRKLDYFGERSVLFNELRTASVKAKGKVLCWVLGRTDFLGIIGKQLRMQLTRRIEMQDASVKLEDLVPIRVLGKGTFGVVYLVTHREKKTLYALKTVSRAKINRHSLHKNIILERKILLQIDHNLVIKLIKTFKDSKRIYFLLEYVSGVDFFDVLRVLGLVSDGDARFYVGNLINILSHLHERDIIYRDLKPENIMVDEEGYLKLIDFGTAKIMNSSRTYSVVGTPHYMAPEMIMGKGYGPAVDFWSLGIILFEIVCGGVPFAEEEVDPYLIYEKILEHRLVYPSFVDLKMPAKAIIEQLLSANPAERIHGSVEKLKRHKWFKGFEWELLESREVSAPYIPNPETKKRERNAALKTKRNLLEFIEKEEGEQTIELDRGESREYKEHPAPPPSWDDEF